MPAKGRTIVATSRFLAQLIGPVAVVAAMGLLANRAAYRAMAQEFLRSPALIYLSGLLTMTAGVAVVLGGAARIALPQQTRAFGEAMLDKPMAMSVGGAVWLLLGALLCFFGYFR